MPTAGSSVSLPVVTAVSRSMTTRVMRRSSDFIRIRPARKNARSWDLVKSRFEVPLTISLSDHNFSMRSRSLRSDAAASCISSRSISCSICLSEGSILSAILTNYGQQPIQIQGLMHYDIGVDPFSHTGTKSGYHHHRNVGNRGIFFLRLAKFPSGHHRHIKVEQDYLRQVRAAQVIEGFLAVARSRDAETFHLEAVGQRLAGAVVVLDD